MALGRTKVCSKCDTDKYLDQFHRNRAKADGLMDHCKECARKLRAARARKLRGRTQPDTGDLETLYVRVPADLKQKIVLIAEDADLSIARATTGLLSMAVSQIEKTKGRLKPKDV